MKLCLPPCLPICFNRPYGEHPYQDIVDSGNNEAVKETKGTTAIKQSQKYFVEKVE